MRPKEAQQKCSINMFFSLVDMYRNHRKIGNRKFLYLTRKIEHLAQTILQNDAIIWHGTDATYESQI
jgi:hypothetical protein